VSPKLASFLPKVQEKFAEFLQYGSLNAWVYSTRSPVSVSGTVGWVKIFPGNGRGGEVIQYTFYPYRPFRPLSLVSSWFFVKNTLRDRVTLRWKTERRNPWTYGDHDCHMICRYSCQHSHFWILQNFSQNFFYGLQNAPLPYLSVAWVILWSPDTLSVLWNSTSELLRFHYRMAASKPIS